MVVTEGDCLAGAPRSRCPRRWRSVVVVEGAPAHQVPMVPGQRPQPAVHQTAVRLVQALRRVRPQEEGNMIMGLFSKPASSKEVRAFGRGKTSSAKAAEAYAKQQRDKAATRKAVAQRKAAEKRDKW